MRRTCRDANATGLAAAHDDRTALVQATELQDGHGPAAGPGPPHPPRPPRPPRARGHGTWTFVHRSPTEPGPCRMGGCESKSGPMFQRCHAQDSSNRVWGVGVRMGGAEGPKHRALLMPHWRCKVRGTVVRGLTPALHVLVCVVLPCLALHSLATCRALRHSWRWRGRGRSGGGGGPGPAT